MDTTDTRPTKNYRIKSGVIKTPIYPDESISSWLIRAALDCGTEPIVFTGFYWEKLRLWTYDLDRGFELIAPFIYDEVSELSINHIIKLQDHSLYNLLKTINAKQTLIKGQAKWVLPRSSRNRTHRNGQPFCSYCLAETPYLRNGWRIAWNYGCLEHKLVLADRCGHCETLYHPHLLSADKRQVNHCHQCGGKIDAQLEPLDDYDIEIIGTLNQVLNSHTGICFAGEVNSKAYFDILRYIINFLRKVAVAKPTYCIVKFVDSLGISQAEICQPKTALAFELLPTHERRNLLRHAFKIMQSSPDLVFKAIKLSGITQKSFAFEFYPNELNPFVHRAKSSQERAERRLPVKPSASGVLALNRKWERLKRQLSL